MQYITDKNFKISAETAVTIGKFDGLHLGHMRLLDELKSIAKARSLATAVLSFSPHPAAVLTDTAVPLIFTAAEKLHLLNEAGIDHYIEYPFSRKFAQKTPEDFIENIVFMQLNCRALAVGDHFRYGKNGSGDVMFAQKLGAQLGFSMHALPDVVHNGTKISSGDLRRLIAEKDFAGFRSQTGRNFFMMGKTACDAKLLPPPGAYNTIIHADDSTFASVTHINHDRKINIKSHESGQPAHFVIAGSTRNPQDLSTTPGDCGSGSAMTDMWVAHSLVGKTIIEFL